MTRSPSPGNSLNRRPLYHYIRSQATDSHSTFDCGVVPEITIAPKQFIAPQQGTGHLARQSIQIFPTSVDELPPLTPAPPIMPFPRDGFSLSGEAEQKMSLARMIHDGRFIFHESKPTGRRDRIMQGIRRSFKSFFNLKDGR